MLPVYETTSSVSFGARIYLGSREGYQGRSIPEQELIDLIGKFQHADTQNSCVVRLTKTTFVWDMYSEPGWEIGLMNYPKGRYTGDMLARFADKLAAYLTTALKQNRVTVEHYCLASPTTMYESPNAEQACNIPGRNDKT